MAMSSPYYHHPAVSAELNVALLYQSIQQLQAIAAASGIDASTAAVLAGGTPLVPYPTPITSAASTWEMPTPPLHNATPNPPVYGGSVTPDDDHKPILAERFKTKMCRNYERTGVCPYVHRCMFAHGDHELRTPEMNMADGLVTEEAIKEFKRINYEARCFAEYQANVANFELMSARSYTPPQTPVVAPSDVSSRSSARSDTPQPRLSYRHDPYAERSMWHPLLGASTSSIALQ